MFPGSRSRRALRLGAVLALAGCDAGPTPPPPPAAVHDLVFVARVNGFDELWRLPLTGGAPRPLLAGTVNAWYPAPSPDGRQVAYVDAGDDDVWLAPVGGAPALDVSRGGLETDVQPAWSPDGTRIAFTTTRTGGTDVYVVNPDGSGLRNLMPNEFPAAAADDAPAWSPDGARLAFSSTRGGTRAIWTVRPDGSDLRPLTAPDHAHDHEPSWSPDGRRIVFRRFHVEGGTARTDLAILTVADGSVAVLALPGTERTPRWSPDGSLIAFTSDRVGGEFRLYTMKPDGTDVVERAGGAAVGRHVMHPAWLRRE